MKFYFPLALAFKFEDFTMSDIFIYSSAAVFSILFAIYYRKKAKGDSIGIVRRREEYVAEHPELSPDYLEAILNGSLINGMNEAEITASIGHPRRIQVLTVEPAKNEVWIYSNGIYAYIHMGILQKCKMHKKLVSFR
jgi:hypothetical protein